MFFNGGRYSYIDLSNFDSSKVTSMYRMFYGAYAYSINIKGLDTKNVINMEGMFSTYPFRPDITTDTFDVSYLDTRNVQNIKSLFYSINCKTLIAKGLDFSKVIGYNLCSIFEDSRVETIDISGWKTGQFYSNNRWFKNCTKLKKIIAIGADENTLANIQYSLANDGLTQEVEVIT